MPEATVTAPPDPPEPTRLDLPRAVVVLGVVALVVLVSGMSAQLAGPYIRRDDWPFLLPPDTPGAADPLAKVRQEGRWLGYAWWLLVGQHGTPVTAVVVFFSAYLLFVLGLWRLFRVTALLAGGLLLAALVVSPLWVRLVYWPGSLSASAVVAAASVWTLPWAARRRRRLVGWVLVVTVLSVLTYPPMGGLLLIAALVHLRDRPWREVLLVVVTFLGGVGAGSLLAVLINGIAFDQFGLAIAQWRRPNGLSSLHDLKVNVRRQLRQYDVLFGTLGWAGVVGLASFAVALVDARIRTAALKVALAVAVVAGLECLQTVVTGVRTNVRGSLWAWPAVVAPAGLLLTGSRWPRRLGAVACVALVVLGMQAWRWDLGTHQATKRSYDAIIAAALTTAAADQTRQTVLYQDPAERRTARGRITAGTLRMMFYEQAGVVVRWCRAEECTRLASRVGQGPVHDLGTVVGVVVPPAPAVL